MLTDLAVKKSMSPDDSTGSSTLSRLGRSSSPRKRRLAKMPSPDSHINGLHIFGKCKNIAFNFSCICVFFSNRGLLNE